MRKIHTAGYTALLAAFTATTLAFHADAATIAWMVKLDGANVSLTDFASHHIPGYASGNADVMVYLVMDSFVKITPANYGNPPTDIRDNVLGSLQNGTFNPGDRNAIGIVSSMDLNNDPDHASSPNFEYFTDNLVMFDSGMYNFFMLIVYADELERNSNGEYTGEYHWLYSNSAIASESDAVFYWFGESQGQPAFNFLASGFYAVPEPATGLLVLGGAAVALLRRRRK